MVARCRTCHKVKCLLALDVSSDGAFLKETPILYDIFASGLKLFGVLSGSIKHHCDILLRISICV
jgi:hypothetical protein